MKKGINRTYVLRFLRTVIPQLVFILPVLIARGQEFEAYLPVWVLPTLVFLGGIITALDKYFRDIKFYTDVKNVFLKN